MSMNRNILWLRMHTRDAIRSYIDPYPNETIGRINDLVYFALLGFHVPKLRSSIICISRFSDLKGSFKRRVKLLIFLKKIFS